MKNLITTSLLLTMTLLSSSAWADHNEGGRIDRLRYETRDLSSMVEYSCLRPNVKTSVRRFHSLVERLRYCGGMIRQMNSPNHLRPNDHNPPPSGGDECYYKILQARDAWAPVENYLYDTYYDFPRVYRQYQSTRQALYAVVYGYGLTIGEN